MCILYYISSLCFSDDEDERMTPLDEENSYDVTLDHYQPINDSGSQAAANHVRLLPSRLSNVQIQRLQYMYNGVTAVRWDGKDSHSSMCYLRLEYDNATLSWSKPTWSSLKGSTPGTLPDYTFKPDMDSSPSTALSARYHSRLSIQEDTEEGFVDVLQIKDVTLGENTNIDLISRRHGLNHLSKSKNCVTILVGGSLSENKTFDFVMSHAMARIWYKGLRRLVHVAHCLRRRHTDRRVQWLKEQYLHLYYESDALLGPTPAEAIRVGAVLW